MPVDPFLTSMLPAPVLPDELDFPGLRAQSDAVTPEAISALAEPGPEVFEVSVEQIATPDGEFSVIVYRPVPHEVLPVHLFIHGGGWALGSAFHPFFDINARERAAAGRCLVVSVDYRKAPEHPYPAGLDDCMAALRWVVENAERLKIDPSRVTVGGASAGANLAAALCLRARDQGGPGIVLQLLETPALDLTLNLPSHHDPELGSKYALHRSDMLRLIKAYVGDDADASNPLISPALASDHNSLPAAFIVSAEFDLLRDDGAVYANKLRESGVKAVAFVAPGHVHNSPGFTRVMTSARAWRDEVLRVLREVNDGTSELLDGTDSCPVHAG